MVVFWLKNGCFLDGCVLIEEWMLSGWLCSDWRMDAFWMVVFWLKNGCFLDGGCVLIEEWMLSGWLCSDWRMDAFWMVVFWLENGCFLGDWIRMLSVRNLLWIIGYGHVAALPGCFFHVTGSLGHEISCLCHGTSCFSPASSSRQRIFVNCRSNE
jgi:hypothetical protein